MKEEKQSRILAVIPARGGSKGVPNKNVRNLGGKPLVVHSIIEAKKSHKITRLIVSTENEEIAEAARNANCEVRIRPEELATDKSPILKTLQHLIKQFREEGEEFDAVMMLQPTTPFRKVEDIDKAIELFENEKADSVVSVCEAPNKYNPHWVRKIKDGILVPYLEADKASPHTMRQQLPKVYWRNGQIYITKTNVLIEGDMYGKKSLPYIMDRGYHVNIDEETDFLLAELLIERGLIKND